MSVSGGAAAGSSRAFRLDPCALPVHSAAEAGSAVHLYLDRQRAVLRHPSAELPRIVTIPVTDYDGVAVRIATDTETALLVLELSHINPDLVVQLSRGGAPQDIAHDWQAWGRELGLPLLLVSPDGGVSRFLDGDVSAATYASQPRRRGSPFGARRPRFLTRRKTGIPERMVHLTAREIIART